MDDGSPPDTPADEPRPSPVPAGWIDACPDMVVWLGRDGSFRGVRPAQGAAPPLSPTRIRGGRVAELFPAPEAARLLEALRGTLADGELRTVELGLPAPPGTRVLEFRLVRVGPDEAAGTVRDQTEARTALDRARAWEARYAAAARAAGLVLFEWSPGDGRLVLGENAARLLGPGAEAIGDLEAWLARVVPDDRDRVRSALAGSLERGGALRIEYRLRGPDGSPIPVRHEAEVQGGGDGRPAGTIGFVSDQSAARDLAAQAQRAQTLEAVERLAGGVAHDFNHLLTLILNYGEFVRGSLEPGHPLLDDLENLASAGERAALLTRQLLALSRTGVRAPAPLDLVEVLRGMEGSLRRLVGPQTQLELRLDPGTGSVRIDRAQGEAALLNLVLNARDATDGRGRITVSVAARQADPAGPGPWVVVEVADDGCGMSTEVQGRLFEPFFTTRREEGRMGLGLAMVHGAVRAMGGRIEVESRPGAGSRVRLVLPAEGDARGRPVPEAPAAPSRRRDTILLVDDAPDIRLVASRALARMGYTVLEAAGSEEATALAAGHPGSIELLLTDVMLPGASGVQVAERVRQLRPGIRVLFTSGALDERSIPDHPEGLPGVFLPKPFTRESLDRKIREAMAAGP